MHRLIWLLLLSGCANAPLRPAPEKLEPWTTTLRDQQPEDAFAAVYKLASDRLVFVAAKHSNQNDSLTFRLIRDAFSNFRIDAVIAEGFPTSRGANPESIFRYVSESFVKQGGFVEAGELAPTVVGARAEAATLWGGEPNDVEIKARILAEGFSADDLLGFYVLRNIPQWIREQKIRDAGDPRLGPLVQAELSRNRGSLQLPPEVLPSYADWVAWYRSVNGRELGAGFRTEEVGPLADGPHGTNRIGYALSKARDEYLHELIIKHLNAKETVLVVFGASHLMIQRPALDAALGRPCYVGTDLTRAAMTCR